MYMCCENAILALYFPVPAVTKYDECFTANTGCQVIGAGVVGLATARALAQRNSQTLLLERNQAPGQETSSRNSEVIHAGIYYGEGTLKSKQSQSFDQDNRRS